MQHGDYKYGKSLGIIRTPYTDQKTGEIRESSKLGISLEGVDSKGMPTLTNCYLSLSSRISKESLAEIGLSTGKNVGIPFLYAQRKGNQGPYLSEEFDGSRPIVAAGKPMMLAA